MTITLMDGIKWNRAHPKTFEIPDDAEKAGVVVGDYVKIGFESTVLKEIPDALRAAKGWPNDWAKSEKMWVIVTQRDGDRFIGELNNVPVLVDMKIGDPVEFETCHILRVEKESEVTRKVMESVAHHTKH